MTLAIRLLAIVVLGMSVSFLETAKAGAETTPRKLTLFAVPSPTLDAIWMAAAKGYFKQEGLEVDIKLFPSGTTALQTFRAGGGDIIFAGELPALNYWHTSGKQFQFIAVLNRNSRELSAPALKDIKGPADLKGKKIGTRVGSTGSWFIAEYLAKHKLSPSDVTVVNLDNPSLPVALCGRDIHAYFTFHPFTKRAHDICPDRVHNLVESAEGYIRGYGILGVRPAWIKDSQNRESVEAFLRAMLKGQEFAKSNLDDVVAELGKRFSLPESDITFTWSIMERDNGFDQTFYQDFCRLSAWMESAGLAKSPINFQELLYPDALTAIDPKLVVAPPKTCS